jgi:adenylate kinase
LNLPNISTGDIFRENIKASTELGKKVKELTEAGQLVPDEVTNKMIAERLRQNDAENGYILDGYPRNHEQALFLDNVSAPDVVIIIDLSEEESMNRISKRRIDKETGEIVSTDIMTEEQKKYYGKNKELLIQRDDDKPAAVKERLAIYHKTTMPIMNHYKKNGKIIEINGDASVETIAAELEKKLKAFK